MTLVRMDKNRLVSYVIHCYPQEMPLARAGQSLVLIQELCKSKVLHKRRTLRHSGNISVFSQPFEHIALNLTQPDGGHIVVHAG
jgi:hypothetical protein